jgi:hypothetical protein
MVKNVPQPPAAPDADWVPFPGGELEGPRPSALCPECRSKLRQSALHGSALRPKTLCFQCYRTSLDRDRRLSAAANLDTASEARFQESLPFDPINQVRLKMLRAEREAARTAARVITGGFEERRRRAQIAARHVLRDAVSVRRTAAFTAAERERVVAAAVHAAELQLPAAWLPFVMAK